MSQTSSNIRGAGSRRNSERATRSDTRTGPERMNEGIGQGNSRPQSRATEDDRDRTEEVPPVPPVNTEAQPVISTIPTTPEPIQPVASGSRRTIPGGLPSFEVSDEQGHGNQSEPTIRQPTPGRPVRLPNVGTQLPDFGIRRNRTATVGPEEEEAVGASSRIAPSHWNHDSISARQRNKSTLGATDTQYSYDPEFSHRFRTSTVNNRNGNAEIGQTTRVLVQSNNAILEQIRGTNDRMDRVEDELRETEQNNRANTANIYQAGLDIRTNMNHVRA
ncbi:hypothetical protein BDV93DRAFT_516504, partial [Ceratobasidium sp. AG-I]